MAAFDNDGGGGVLLNLKRKGNLTSKQKKLLETVGLFRNNKEISLYLFS